ncbi:MAG: phosphotransferase, partial [Jatrophihabitans sp.]
MPSSAGGQLLGGAVANRGRVFRVGDTVRRPVAPCRQATHALLRHLEAVGFGGSPRLLGADETTETLSWIPGQAARHPLPDWALGDDTLASVAVLVRGFHHAADSFGTGASARHRWPVPVPTGYRGGRLSHNDLHPGNIIFADGRAVGRIDFDLAGPGGPIWDLATVARCWVPLVDDPDLPAELAADPDRRLERTALLLDAYGLAAADRPAVIDALIANHDWTYRI